MVETASYVLRSLTEDEDRQLTLQLANDLPQVPTDKNDLFSTKKYELTRGLKRHQANGELRRLQDAGFIKPVEGHFPRWSPLHGAIAKAPEPAIARFPSLVCVRLLSEEEKGCALIEALHRTHDMRRFVVSPEDFQQVPNSPFCYWVSNHIRELFAELPPFESSGRAVRQGLVTADDFRFVRLWSEVPWMSMCPPSAHPDEPDGAYCVHEDYRWFPFAKGGAFSPFYSDIHLVVNWQRDGAEIRSFIDPKTGRTYSRPQNTEYYFRKGLTWPIKNRFTFNPRPLPAGSIFAHVGAAGFVPDTDQLWSYQGLLGGIAFTSLLRITAGWNFEVGVVQRTPIVSITGNEGVNIGAITKKAVELKRSLDSMDETSHVFHLPVLLRFSDDTIGGRAEAWQKQALDIAQQIAAHQREIDDIAFRLYRISGEDRRDIEQSVVDIDSTVTDGEQTEVDGEVETENAFTGQRNLAADLISYAVGCVLRRWDIRFATREQPERQLPEAFAALPICSPGALTGKDGLPLSEAPEGYQLRVDSDGILVDDPSHDDDIVRRVRDVFELIWPKAAEAREREACELLAVKELRDCFRKPATGGFWMDHVRRYSKSRRKAPIYWMLRSSKGNYAIWLYYHRLDKDILYKVLLKYVEPKLRLEENNLSQLRQRRETVGTIGREAKLLEKELDKQESFISELHDFHGKLKRVADLHLEPDLNDGVVLNIAPLWELVPWTEAKKYWKELLDGKYEWSSIGKQLRERNMVKA